MSDGLVLVFFLQIVLIALNAVFASAEIAVLSLNATKLERMAGDGDKRAIRLQRLMKEPARFLATIQVAITLSGFLGSAFAADNFSDPLVDWVLTLGVHLPRATLDTIAVILITLILSYVTLIFGELVPKRIAMRRSETIAMGISGMVSGISIVFKPLVWLLSVSTNLVLRLFGIRPDETEEKVTEEEIRMLVDAGSEKGAINRQEKEFIQNVFEFNDTTAGELATHRTEVEILWMKDDEATWEKTILDSPHALYPVCDGSPDDVVGVLNAKEYFRLPDKSRASVLSAAVHPAYFVPKTLKADVLFRNLKSHHTSMAIVLDDFAGMVGVVTMNDLLEELVGDLGDVFPDQNNTRIEPRGENQWAVFGNVDLETLSEAIQHPIASEEDVHYFSGYVFHEWGQIPDDGLYPDEVRCGNLLIRNIRIENHQIVAADLRWDGAGGELPPVVPVGVNRPAMGSGS